ncbi:unnamed protein product [Vitrella brassicaformis CCMP3155]|uniref:Pentacotripeptide-repeat region of PRORP domain-containing protein n=1 Tax=Vitrella brassicaformis (strain CCMP3155) TaxID=1169540 RepID=A0A0G4GS49_VITBC|nr:unnamed protein product [Vitrella brassicaformis CCMP3155]|eukprot:CEM33439.1 unnamed protein product [Vitrella brassicaformis CCMP3155]
MAGLCFLRCSLTRILPAMDLPPPSFMHVRQLHRASTVPQKAAASLPVSHGRAAVRQLRAKPQRRSSDQLAASSSPLASAVPMPAPPNASEFADVTRRRNDFHRKMWRSLHRKRWDAFEEGLEALVGSGLPMDEVSFTLALHGCIMSKKHRSEEAWDVLQQMEEAHVHPTLVRFNKRLVASFFELSQYDAAPHPILWRKVLRSAWFVAASVRARRQRAIMYRAEQLREAGVPESELPDPHSLAALWYGPTDPLLTPLAQAQALTLDDQAASSTTSIQGGQALPFASTRRGVEVLAGETGDSVGMRSHPNEMWSVTRGRVSPFAALVHRGIPLDSIDGPPLLDREPRQRRRSKDKPPAEEPVADEQQGAVTPAPSKRRRFYFDKQGNPRVEGWDAPEGQ